MLRPSLHSWFQTASLLLRQQQLYALTIILTLGLTLGALVATFNLNYQLLLQLTLLDSLKPLLWAVLLLAMSYSALQLSLRLGWSFNFAQQLQIAPLHAVLALLTVLLLTAAIVLGCMRPLLSRPAVQALRGE
ncbi:hypothetical protein [Rheinheimera sp. NSM]|uniref:hypothetical protein n=1 Tax=Rheinheimera sp. NSM TaxID=3457884 RepID=UPI0040353747